MHGLHLVLQRPVDDCGETLIVRDFQGVKVLADPVEDVIVIVPVGRRADLVRFSLGEDVQLPANRDIHVITARCDVHFGFVVVGVPHCYVLLDELPAGQIVDILPYLSVATVRAALPRMPFISEAVAVPTYTIAA